MKLGPYLKSVDKTPEAFAREIGRSPVAVYRWIAGKRHPRGVNMALIMRATDGAVTANDFYEPDSDVVASTGRSPVAA